MGAGAGLSIALLIGGAWLLLSRPFSSRIYTMDALMQGIAKAEGFGIPGKLPTVRHNPGSLTANGQLRTFATDGEGWAALRHQLDLIFSGQSAYYSPDMSILDLARVWTGEDNAAGWAATVSQYVGLPSSSRIGDYQWV